MAKTTKVSRIQKRGQVTIPIEIRHKLHLEEGDLVAFIETSEGIIISPQEVVPAPSRHAPLQHEGDAHSTPKHGALEALFTFDERLTQGNLEDDGAPTSAREPSLVDQTAGILRRRQEGRQGAINFEQARQAFIEYLAHQADPRNSETADSDS
jgi:AbrB family looped-hinge helix DNA binding protein